MEMPAQSGLPSVRASGSSGKLLGLDFGNLNCGVKSR